MAPCADDPDPSLTTHIAVLVGLRPGFSGLYHLLELCEGGSNRCTPRAPTWCVFVVFVTKRRSFRAWSVTEVRCAAADEPDLGEPELHRLEPRAQVGV